MHLEWIEILNVAVTLLILLVIICCWIMIWDSNRFVIMRYSFESDKVKKRVRFIFLSDLHDKSYGTENKHLLQEIDKQNPDFILIGGDMIKAKPNENNHATFAFLKKLSQKYKVYYALGNHEYRARIYPQKYGSMYEEFYNVLCECGIDLLDNKHVFLDSSNVLVAGLTIDREFYKRFKSQMMESDYIESLLGKQKAECYCVMMAHNPDYFEAYAGWGADLVLSGHVHGGVVRIPFGKGVISPSLRLFPHFDGGLFKEYGSNMVLSRGLGMHTIPVRLFNPGEVIIVELLPSSR